MNITQTLFRRPSTKVTRLVVPSGDEWAVRVALVRSVLNALDAVTAARLGADYHSAQVAVELAIDAAVVDAEWDGPTVCAEAVNRAMRGGLAHVTIGCGAELDHLDNVAVVAYAALYAVGLPIDPDRVCDLIVAAVITKEERA